MYFVVVGSQIYLDTYCLVYFKPMYAFLKWGYPYCYYGLLNTQFNK